LVGGLGVWGGGGGGGGGGVWGRAEGEMKRGDGSKGTVTECWVQWHRMTRRGSRACEWRASRARGAAAGAVKKEQGKEGGVGGAASWTWCAGEQHCVVRCADEEHAIRFARSPPTGLSARA